MRGTSFDVVVVAPLRGDRPGRANWEPTPIDGESLDEVFRGLAPRISLATAGDGGAPLDWEPRSPDEFHPDRLLKELPALRALGNLRRAAEDPTVFREAGGGDASTFERLIGGRPSPSAGLDAFVRSVVGPHLVPDRDPRQDEMLRALDAASAHALRAVLRAGPFQSLEGAWNGLRRVVSHVDPSSVRVFVVAATREDLATDALDAGSDGVPPALRRGLERAIAGGALSGNGLIVVDLLVGARRDELALLTRLGVLAGTVGLPLVAGAAPGLVGAASAEDLADPSAWSDLDAGFGVAWEDVQGSAIAPWVGLVVPRVLGRLPYGSKISPVESIPFEEAVDGPDPSAYPWMNGAFVVGELAAAGEQAGWAEDFPAVAHDVPDGRRMRPAAEAVLPDRAARALQERGLIPLVADVTRAAVAIPQIQSIASGGVTPLGGR